MSDMKATVCAHVIQTVMDNGYGIVAQVNNASNTKSNKTCLFFSFSAGGGRPPLRVQGLQKL